ncbi:MAG TPA: hypothetical protein VK939_02895 [Longimicrobiales bacterium]|nr:hypothetical protein [Longimicrobiales bacterium]
MRVQRDVHNNVRGGVRVSRLRLLLAELRRRKVLHVAAAYLFVSWGIIQVTSTVLQMASGAPWLGKVVLAVVAVGFPIALVVAWFFDLSSAGIVRTAALDADQRARALGERFSASHALAIAGVLLIAASVVGFAVWLRPSDRGEVEFMQLTNFADAATAPALSPDGRMLAFLKGQGLFGNSAAPSQLYVKQLPDGAEVQLTSSDAGKATPVFSPDGARIYFTAVTGNFDWGTHVVSVNGGPESPFLPNGSGLSFLDEQSVLFAEIRAGTQMGFRRATLARENVADVYWPAENGMAHRAAVSPDREWVLLVEMDGGVWQPCRLVPLDGSSPGRTVGPPASQCTYAAWSPDGRWMYFSSNASGTFHLWRQRFPRGEPEQLTSGATEEEGIAVAPDGRSLITSAGVRHNSISLLDSAGDRQVSVEGFAFSPVAGRDGRHVYFLSRDGIARLAYNVGRLVVVTLADGARHELLPGYRMVHFDLSADDRTIVFASGDDAPDRRGIWVGPLDRSAAPRRVYAEEVERVFFDRELNIYFLSKRPDSRYLHRLRAPDYRIDERIHDQPIWYMFSISPDGQWVVAVMNVPSGRGLQQVAIPTRGGAARVLCGFCGGGAGPARVLAPAVSWTRDGRAMLVSAQFGARMTVGGPQHTILVPVMPDAVLPELPAEGVAAVSDYLALPGARRVAESNVLPGANPDQLFFYRTTTIRNLYRVQLPD